MTMDELETLLRAWGRVFGERPPVDEEDDSRRAPAVHALARGMEMAPGRRHAVIRQRTTLHRGGIARRTLMAQAAGAETVGIRIVPASYVDPVPCKETRSYRSESRDWPVPPELARVERAALDLMAFDDFRGRCLRVNYCTRGSHEDKVLRLGVSLGRDVKLKSYRDAIAAARIWMHARLA